MPSNNFNFANFYVTISITVSGTMSSTCNILDYSASRRDFLHLIEGYSTAHFVTVFNLEHKRKVVLGTTMARNNLIPQTLGDTVIT